MLDHASRVHPQRRPQTCACLAAIALTLACRPAPAPPPAPLTGETAICIGIGYPIPSTVFAASRTVNVYLPADYDSSTARYPVVYLVDGGVTQDFHPVSGIAALAGLSGQFREFIVVGVQTEDRHFELSSHSEIPEDLEHIARNGGSDKFRQHLLEEVKPFVELMLNKRVAVRVDVDRVRSWDHRKLGMDPTPVGGTTAAFL